MPGSKLGNVFGVQWNTQHRTNISHLPWEKGKSSLKGPWQMFWDASSDVGFDWGFMDHHGPAKTILGEAMFLFWLVQKSWGSSNTAIKSPPSLSKACRQCAMWRICIPLHIMSWRVCAVFGVKGLWKNQLKKVVGFHTIGGRFELMVIFMGVKWCPYTWRQKSVGNWGNKC